MSEDEREKEIRRVRLQLKEWADSIWGHVEDYFNGKYVGFNIEVKTMADMNRIPSELLRQFVFLYYTQRKRARDEEQKRAIQERINQVCEEIVQHMKKRSAGRLTFLR